MIAEDCTVTFSHIQVATSQPISEIEIGRQLVQIYKQCDLPQHPGQGGISTLMGGNWGLSIFSHGLMKSGGQGSLSSNG